MPDSVVTFIGAGNMASSLIGGMLAQGWPADVLRASDPLESNRRRQQQRGVQSFSDNRAAVSGADVVVLAVKPQVLRKVCEEIAPALDGSGCLVLSIAAGVETASIGRWLGEETALIRCMPNTPALVQLGASVLYATAAVTAQQRSLAGDILASVGQLDWVDDEQLLHAVTALSGSGPAYFFLLTEALMDCGEQLGLPRELASRLAIRTGLGATTMAAEAADLLALRRQVTSPGGTTERAVAAFEEGGLRPLVCTALEAACRRSRELAAILDTDGEGE